MEALFLIVALIIVVAVPQLIVNRYFPREKVSIGIELKQKKLLSITLLRSHILLFPLQKIFLTSFHPKLMGLQ